MWERNHVPSRFEDPPAVPLSYLQRQSLVCGQDWLMCAASRVKYFAITARTICKIKITNSFKKWSKISNQNSIFLDLTTSTKHVGKTSKFMEIVNTNETTVRVWSNKIQSHLVLLDYAIIPFNFNQDIRFGIKILLVLFQFSC